MFAGRLSNFGTSWCSSALTIIRHGCRPSSFPLLVAPLNQMLGVGLPGTAIFLSKDSFEMPMTIILRYLKSNVVSRSTPINPPILRSSGSALVAPVGDAGPIVVAISVRGGTCPSRDVARAGEIDASGLFFFTIGGGGSTMVSMASGMTMVAFSIRLSALESVAIDGCGTCLSFFSTTGIVADTLTGCGRDAIGTGLCFLITGTPADTLTGGATGAATTGCGRDAIGTGLCFLITGTTTDTPTGGATTATAGCGIVDIALFLRAIGSTIAEGDRARRRSTTSTVEGVVLTRCRMRIAGIMVGISRINVF